MLDGILRPRLRFKPRLTDWQAGPLAYAVGAVLDLAEGGVDFAEEVAVLLHEAEREFLLVVVGAHVGHVHRQVRKVAAATAVEGLALHRRHVADELAAL